MSNVSPNRRRVSLSAVIVETYGTGAGSVCACLTYLGTVDALVAAGCLTPFMLKAWRRVRKNAKGKSDEHGESFHMHRSPTKGSPERMRLRRSAMWPATHLPGVRELFPEGAPELEQDLDGEPAEWTDRIAYLYQQLNPYQKAQTRAFIQQVVEKERQRRIRGTRPSYLRLVVDTEVRS